MGKKIPSRKNRQGAKPAKQVQQSQAIAQPLESAQLQQRPSILSGNAKSSGPVRSVPKQNLLALDQGEYVRGDIIRIGLLLAIIAIILGILVVAVDKSPRFRQVGQHLATSLRLQ